MPVIGLRRALPACALLFGVLAGVAVARGQGVETFASVMASAMARMDRDMMQPSSGNADRDFATMMIPHHQGAIDMAEAELRFGHDQVLRRLAQGIVVAQRQEIAVMRQALAAMPAAATAPRPARKEP
jgi:uncharacterized protein (DUF305 family)